MMYCTTCGLQNDAQARFCVHCGKPLPKVCTKCGKANDLQARFCVDCGEDVVVEGSEFPAGNVTPPREPIVVSEGEFICPVCSYQGRPRQIAKGSWLVASLLLLFFIVPGLLYLIFASGYRYVCPTCGYQHRQDIVR